MTTGETKWMVCKRCAQPSMAVSSTHLSPVTREMEVVYMIFCCGEHQSSRQGLPVYATEARAKIAASGLLPVPGLDQDRQRRWDLDYLALAEFWARRKSKDPSTKVCAVVVDANNDVAALGYNGFPKGVDDSPERYADRAVKYSLVVHAEQNALSIAEGRSRGGTIYIWPLFSCNECAKIVIQRGIRRVVSPSPDSTRWSSAYDTALLMYKEAGVLVDFVDV